MTRTVRALLSGAVALVMTAAPARANSAGSGIPVQISQDMTTESALIGSPFSFTTTVRNSGDHALRGLVAHLNVVSMDPGVYVDPEDWSTHRTQYLTPVPAQGSVRLAWSVHAVNAGRFVVYVALATSAGDSVVAGPALHTVVHAPQQIDATGILPVAIAVPAAVLVLLVAARYRRRNML
jgi:hypothetical protein